MLWSRIRPRVGVFSSVGSSFAVFGLQALHAILLARLLGPTGRGEYGTAMFYTQTMLYIGLAGTLYSIARRAAQPRSDYAPLQRSALRVGLLTGAISMAIAVALSFVAVPADKRHILPLCMICALMLPIEHMRLTSLAVDHGRGKFLRYNVARVSAAAIFPAIVLVLYFSGIKSLSLIASITVLVPLAGYAIYYWLSDTKQLSGSSEPPPLQLIREGRSDGVAVLAGDLFDRLGNFLLLWMVTMQDYGFYVTALPAASLLLVGPHTIALYAFRAAHAERGMTTQQLCRYAAAVVLAQGLALAAMLLILSPLLLFVFGSAFIGIAPVAKILLFAMAANGCVLVGDGYLRGRGKASYGVWTRLAAALCMLISVALLPESEALPRVAQAMAIGYAVNALLTFGMCVVDTYRMRPTNSESTVAA